MKTLFKLSAIALLMTVVFAFNAKADFNTWTDQNKWVTEVLIPINIVPFPPGPVSLPPSGLLPPGVSYAFSAPYTNVDLVFEASGGIGGNYKIDATADWAIETPGPPPDNHIYMTGLTLQADTDDDMNWTGADPLSAFTYVPPPIGSGPFTTSQTWQPFTFTGDGNMLFRAYPTGITAENNAFTGAYSFNFTITATYIP